MESLCRLCGSEDGIKVNIFDQGLDRVRKIHKILPITVNEYDPFPKQICHRCSFKVDQFFEFRTTSIKTQEIFKKKIPWLRDKQLPQRNEGELPMVEVTLNSVNAVSPSEKDISQSNGSVYDMDEDNAILIEDSPPYVEPSNGVNTLVSEFEVDEKQNRSHGRRHKRSRSMWDTKKRKKKNRKCFRIAEVFSTSEQEYQNLNDIENNPLSPSPVDNVDYNSCDNTVENSSCIVNSPKSDVIVVEKGILTDDRVGANIDLPKYILVTKIPRVGNVFTCERCGRTFLNPQPASQHYCHGNHTIPVEDNRPKEEPKDHDEAVETVSPKDFYQCSECGYVFTRHSQLVSHQKKHNNQEDYSSDDSFKPKKRKKHHKRKHKVRMMDTNTNCNSTSTITNNLNSNSTTSNDYNSNSATTNNNYNSDSSAGNTCDLSSSFKTPGLDFLFNLGAIDTNITRHALLSSDSE